MVRLSRTVQKFCEFSKTSTTHAVFARRVHSVLDLRDWLQAKQDGTANLVSASRWSPWWASIAAVTVAGGGPAGYGESESNDLNVTRRWTRGWVSGLCLFGGCKVTSGWVASFEFCSL